MKSAETKKFPPIKFVQFGEGLFNRTLAIDIIQQLNDETTYCGSLAIVSLSSQSKEIKSSPCYKPISHIHYQGIAHGKPIQKEKEITCIKDYIDPVSDFNSFISLAKIDTLKLVFTEYFNDDHLIPKGDFHKAPNQSSIGKLVQFLHARFFHFEGNFSKGLNILSITQTAPHQNFKGGIIRLIEQWNLEASFLDWINQSCTFYDSFADRILSSEPKRNIENGGLALKLKQSLTVEPYFLWAIKGKAFPRPIDLFHSLDNDFRLVEELDSFIFRKKRVFDGIKMVIAVLGTCMDKDHIADALDDDFLAGFIKGALTLEISSTLKHRFNNLDIKTKSHPLNPKLVDQYHRQVLSRLNNPFITQSLIPIRRNIFEKFQDLILPIILEYHQKMGYYPLRLIYVFACFVNLYSKSDPRLEDHQEFLDFVKNLRTIPNFEKVKAILGNKNIWGRDLSQEPLLTEILYYALEQRTKNGIKRGFYFFYRNQIA
ncbi:MAG: hypothetical protein OXE77_08465 [Flavobacteriaceae bacterium]|nr:hypothetical protein [Flavobacteriaceae bacterium]MCY4267089.1 hypothetical protein [Flavobacteriaceae bacterium]